MIKLSKEDKTSILIIVTVLIGVILIYISIIMLLQPDFLFHPSHDKISYEKLKNIEEFEEIEIDTSKEKIHGWIKYNEDKNKKSPLVIFFQGNAQCSSNMCLNYCEKEMFKYFSGYNILVMDYPGYGLSEGTPSDKSMFKMALDTYEYAINLENVDKENIVILGYSIGTGVATYLASQVEINGLILLSPYDDSTNLYNRTLDIFHGPLKLLMRYKFNTKKYASKVNVDSLIIASTDDQVVPYDLSINLKGYFKNIYDFVTMSNISHSEVVYNEIVLTHVQKYLEERVEKGLSNK